MLRAALPGGLVSLPVLVALGLAWSSTACKPAKIKSTQDNSELGQVVAKVDDNVITVGDVQERINKQAPFIRSRYTTIDKKKEFLDNLIRFEVMAAEAQKRGYDKDPEVIRVMKQQMISKFLQKDFESKLKIEDVPDAEVEKYYSAHPEEFNRKDEVRVSQILVKDKAKAEKVAAEVRALSKTTPTATTTTTTAPAAADQKPFRDLVAKYSEDEDSKQRAGDLTFFDKDSVAQPRPLVDAAFKLAEVGDVAGPIKSDKGFHIIKLTQKKPGFTRPLPEVKRQIQQRLFRDLRTKSMESFIADLRKKSKIDIHEDMLAKVLVDSGMNGESGGNMAGMPPGMSPGMHPAPPGAMHPMGAMSPAGSPPGGMPAPGAMPHSGATTAAGAHLPPPSPPPPAGAAKHP
ncbi:MAG TPA: peptidyl-prolyl cis-trans isomerase [Polyangia bacterium]|jgi:peptidyl-prolyl cis-trans isomerase C|nr:peptidyl-prolyl cis-trans isomerase [Polyangia bacterium]